MCLKCNISRISRQIHDAKNASLLVASYMHEAGKNKSLNVAGQFRFNWVLFGAALLLSLPLLAETPKIIFEENKAQWPEQVLFQANIKGGSIFLEKNTFTYLFQEPGNFHDEARDPKDTARRKFHAFKASFQDSDPNVEVSGNNLLEGHRNYYLGNDPGKWAEKVKLYSRVQYRSLYPLVDLTMYTSGENLKYDLIVHPGGNPKNIKIHYTGPDKMHLEYGHLYIQTSVGLILEQKPYAYQDVNGQKKQIACRYLLKKNILSFELGEYDRSLPLVIDPTLIASTYSGSTVDNRGFTATYDAAGNIYTGGMTLGNGYPVTAGAFQQVHNGGTWDIVLSKFNPTGSTLLFSTYYGGTGDEQPHSIIVNSNNELFVAGRTNSANFPVTAGVFQNTNAGLYDIIVGKISSTGGLLASTYVGGTGDDCINVAIGNGPFWAPLKYSRGDDGRSEVIIDANSNVYVAGCTQSTDFPTSAGAYDNSLSGVQDGVVFKMNSSLTSLSFSTYLGGSGYEACYGIKTDNSGKIYTTGGTSSSDFPIPAAGVINPVFGGDVDGFIAVFDPSLSGPAQFLRSTYLGTVMYDQSFLLEIDASNDLYIYGQSKGNYPVTAGAYCYPVGNPQGGMFIHKVTGNLTSTVFSTVIGTGGYIVNLSPTAFLVDSCQTIYISGFGRCSAPWAVPDSGSTTGLPITPNAYQSATDGCDLYVAVLTPNAKSLYYATYFGGVGEPRPDHVDGGTSRFDKRGVIYESVCASCGSTTGAFPTTPTAYSTNNNSTCNNAVFKMDVSVNPIAQANVTGATQGCAPFQVCFNNTGSAADYFFWDFGDGGTSTQPGPCYTFNFPGTFTVTLYATDSVGICGFSDTSLVTITVGQSPVLTANATPILCNGGVSSATVSPTGGITPYTYAWSLTGGSASIATGLAVGNYTVTVSDATGCTSTQTVSVAQPAALSISTTTVGATCGVSNGSATATAGGGSPSYTYNWSNGQTTTSATGLAAGTHSITVTDQNGCAATQLVVVPVTNAPSINVAATASVSCNGGANGAATASLSGNNPPYTYAWSPATAGTNQNATGLSAGTYTITITDSAGCSNQSTVSIYEPPALVVVISPTHVLCLGGNTGAAAANTTGGMGAYTYLWSTSPVQTTQTATGLIAGSYSVLVTDANGCTATATVTLTQPALGILVSTSTSGSSCGGMANGGISSTVANGSPAYSYAWLPSGQTTASITNIPGGTYTVTVTDANGCTGSAITTMPVSVQPLADFSYLQSVSCEGMNIQITDSSTNALSWEWNITGMDTSSAQNPSFVFPYSGTYTITLIVSNPPCKDTLTKTVVVGDFASGLDLFAANVFSPNGDGENDCFFPSVIDPNVGLPDNSLVQCTYLEVYDRWGVKMYESIGLNGINCWNGNTKNDSQPASDGTYYYVVTLGQTTLKGYVTLARHK